VILGTGMNESILGAILSKKGNKILNIDIDSQYSSSHMTKSLKEYVQNQE
jgi:RAB protein geranylgeranyltransferase component A